VSRSTTRIASAEYSTPAIDQQPPLEQSSSLRASLFNYALTGLAAASLLGLIEWIDLNILLTPSLESLAERVTLTAYFSLNLLVAAVLGLCVGLFIHGAIVFKRLLLGVLSGERQPKRAHKLAAAVAVVALGGGLLYLQPGVFGFTLGAIREAEKIGLARILLRAEHLFTYFVITGLLVSCWAIWAVARSTESMHKLLRLAWITLIGLLIAGAYYVDSRIEVLQYEFSLHRAMFLLEFTLAIALAVSLRFSLPERLQAPIVRGFGSKIVLALALIVVISGVAFTFVRFDKNQNLKALLFSRSTHTKQFFKLAQWALDFDRDGYSAVLGGGDAADTQPGINPGRTEIVGDGTDNNCIGGELTQGDLDVWMRSQTDLNTATNPAAKRFNVIFIFIDAVRADHLSAYGYGKSTSPNLEKLAARGCIFDNAFTPSPSTYQAVPKFMQSTYWDAHLQTWTEVLAHNGYDTVLFPGRRAATLYRRIKDPRMISSARTGNLRESVDAVIDKFSKSAPDRPLCAYLYGFEPHFPYKPRSDFNFGPTQADRYDGELAYADHQLGRLFDWLDQSGAINNTIIVVMSDHGESLGERNVYKHNAQLYNEQMRVPIIFYAPNLPPRRLTDYVSTIDLGSTILNAVGIACPKDYAGVSLLPLMRGESFIRPPVYGEHWQRNDSPFLGPEHNVDPEIRKFMVISQDGYKLIYNRNAYSFELFNLKEDQKELRNLFDHMPEKAAELKRLLGRFVDVVLASRPPDADEQRFFRGSQSDELDE